ARLAPRRMIPSKSGVIMTVTTLQSRTGNPMVGGYGPAMAAKAALTRDLSAELAPAGIPVVGLRPQAMPEGTRRRRTSVGRGEHALDLRTCATGPAGPSRRVTAAGAVVAWLAKLAARSTALAASSRCSRNGARVAP